jgi:hypothetical protein
MLCTTNDKLNAAYDRFKVARRSHLPIPLVPVNRPIHTIRSPHLRRYLTETDRSGMPRQMAYQALHASMMAEGDHPKYIREAWWDLYVFGDGPPW